MPSGRAAGASAAVALLEALFASVARKTRRRNPDDPFVRAARERSTATEVFARHPIAGRAAPGLPRSQAARVGWRAARRCPPAHIAACRRPLIHRSKAKTDLEDIRGQGRDRLAGARGQIQDREGFALSALRARRGARHHQRAIRAEPAHRRVEAVGAQERQGRVHQPRGLAHLQRLLRLRDRAGQASSSRSTICSKR